MTKVLDAADRFKAYYYIMIVIGMVIYKTNQISCNLCLGKKKWGKKNKTFGFEQQHVIYLYI